MAKRLEKAKLSPFWVGAAIYAAVALVIVGIALACLWSFLSAYEASRPRNTANRYMETLDARHILDEAGEALLDQVDSALRDEEACRAQILAALDGKITCARNISKSTDEIRIYALRQGGRVIGSFRMERTGRPSWGFTPWVVTGEEFDLSFLLEEGISVTVPEDCTVLVNGTPLPRDHVTGAILYPQFAELADSGYDLPVMLRYETGSLLEKAAVTVTDREGNEVDPEADPRTFLDNCSEEEQAELEKTVRTFLIAYVDYTTRNGNEGNLTRSLKALKPLMIPGGELDKRMDGVRSSLSDIPPEQTATVTDLKIDLISRLNDDLYFCDVTYAVKVKNPYSQYQAVSRTKLVFRRTGDRLLAESMIIF